MKTLLAAALVLSIIATSAVAKDDSRDGNWWRQQQPIIRTTYVIGFFDGAGSIGKGTSYQRSEDVNALHRSAEAIIGNAKAGQIAEGLDVFYRDFRNRSILTADAFWVVALSIRGVAAEAIEKRTNELRRGAQ